MDKKNINIIYSLLNQVGGPLGYKDLFAINADNQFYTKWRNFIDRALNDITKLSSEEKVFLIRAVIKIKNKLDWEATTVTGYSDEEIAQSIEIIKNQFKIDSFPEEELISKIPQELT